MKKPFYGWIIVGISFWILSIDYAVWYAFPLFYVEILKEFGWLRAETALIFSIGSVVYGVGSPLGGFLLDRFGPRKTITLSALFTAVGLFGCSLVSEIWHFFLFWGGMVSFGICTAGFVPLVALVSKWFTRRRATAVGIAQAGGRESFLMTPLIQMLIMSLGWRATYRTLAALAAVLMIIPAQFLRHSPQEMGLLPDGEKTPEDGKGQQPADRAIIDAEWAGTDWTAGRSLKRFRFWALFFTLFSMGVGYGIVLTHQVAFMVDIGFTSMFASFILLLYGVSCMVGRFSGFLSDLFGREVTYAVGAGGTILSFLMLLLARDASDGWALYVYAVVFGFFSGIISPTFAASAADIFMGRYFGAILGFLNAGYGLGNSFGAWFGGYNFDVSGSYTIAFMIAMAALASAATFLWLSSPGKIRLVGGKVPKTP